MMEKKVKRISIIRGIVLKKTYRSEEISNRGKGLEDSGDSKGGDKTKEIINEKIFIPKP